MQLEKLLSSAELCADKLERKKHFLNIIFVLFTVICQKHHKAQLVVCHMSFERSHRVDYKDYNCFSV